VAAVKTAQEAGKSVGETARELGISGSRLRRWIDEYGKSAFPCPGNALFNSSLFPERLSAGWWTQESRIPQSYRPE